MKIELPYGHAPLVLDVDPCSRVLEVPTVAAPRAPLGQLIDEALDAPIGGPPLESYHPRRATVIVSDATRDEPRRAFVEAIVRRLPRSTKITIAVATGTHGPSDVAALGLGDLPYAVVNHDGHHANDLIDLGTTVLGTPIRVHRCVVETDLVIATGVILPHYFAGFGAGGKAVFPGLGEATAIRINHRHKSHPSARAGVVDENPVRRDLEEAVRAIPAPIVLVNGVAAADHQLREVVVGDVIAAHRAGCAIARPFFAVRASPSAIVLASDALPITASLYQAAKIAAAVAPLATSRLILAAECADGIGPLEIVNEAIFRIGVFPRLRPNVRLELLSGLPDISQTLLHPVGDLRGTELLIIPHASQLIIEVNPA